RDVDGDGVDGRGAVEHVRVRGAVGQPDPSPVLAPEAVLAVVWFSVEEERAERGPGRGDILRVYAAVPQRQSGQAIQLVDAEAGDRLRTPGDERRMSP